MLISKAMYAEFCEGTMRELELYDHLINNFTLKAIVTDYIELLKQTKVNNTKITVDRQEMDAILSLFRVRKERTIINSEGKIETIPEKRGRNRKPKEFKTEETSEIKE